MPNQLKGLLYAYNGKSDLCGREFEWNSRKMYDPTANKVKWRSILRGWMQMEALIVFNCWLLLFFI